MRSPTSQSLGSFCRTHSFFRTKLAFLSFYKIHYSDFTNKICLALEYFQVISQLLLFDPRLEKNIETENKLVFQIITYSSKLLNPSHLLKYENSDSTTIIILIMILSLSILKSLLFTYVSSVAHWSWKKIDILFWLWRWIFKLQGRVIYYFLTSFWVRAIIEAREGSFSIDGLHNNALIGVAAWMIGQEVIFSFFIETQFCYILPSRDFLSSKTYSLQVLTLTQKLMVQLCQLVFESKDLLAAVWITSMAILICSLCRIYQFYSKLPLYRGEALKFQARFLSLVFSLEVGFLAHTIARSVDEVRADLNFLIVIWLILAGLCWKLFREYLLERRMELLQDKNDGVPEFLVHKISFYKGLKEEEGVEMRGKNMSLFGTVLDLQIKGNEDENKIFLNYLEKITKKYANSSFIELHKAYLENQNIASYSKIIKTILNIRQKKWSNAYLSSSILLYQVESSIRASYGQSSSSLDLEGYLNNYLKFMNLKESMLEEAELKVKVCEDMLEKTSNLGEIAKLSQKIDKVKRDIEKKSINLLRNIPDQYVSPLLIYAQYQITLNYSLEQYEKYVERFNNQCMKFEKSLKETTMNNENLYQSNNAILLISGEKANNGQILFCSPSIRNICGKENNSFVGSHVSRLFPSSFGVYYGDLFRGVFTTKENSILNKPMSVFLQNQDGHIIKSEIYIQVHPYVTLNLCLQMMIRPVPTVKDYLLVSEDGVIEGASHKISELLDVSPGSVNIEDICEELFYLLIEKEQIINGNMRMLQFCSVMKRRRNENNSPNYWYQCELQTVTFGEKSLKLISLNQSDKGKSSIFHKERTLFKIQNLGGEDEDDSSLTESENIDDCDEKIDDNNNMKSMPSPTSPRETHIFTEVLPTSPVSPLRIQVNDRLLTLKDTERFELAHSSPRGENEEVSISQRLKSNSLTHRSREVQNYRYFRTAINSSSDPKSFMILCLIFYCAIVGVCVGQILLMVVSIQTMDDLEVKKDLLRWAEARSFRANMISINSIGGALQIAGALDPSDVLQGVLSVVSNIDFHRAALVEANDNILNTLDRLDSSLQDNLRMKDVQLTGSSLISSDSSSVDVTSFQFVDSIGGAITGLVELANPSSSQGALILNFLSTNIANDFLAKNQGIRDVFIESVEEQRQDLENTINLCLILSLLLLLGLALTILLIIWAQYKIERDYLLAFLKLSPSAVRRIQLRFRSFAKSLMNEGKFKSIDGYGNYLFSLSSIIQEEFKTYNRKQKDKLIKYFQLQKKYYAFVAKSFSTFHL